MKILFTICARAGSKGLKNKNLKDFLDHPLSFYTVSIIDLFIKKHSDYECDIVLNTDSEDLITLFKNKLNLSVEIVERKSHLAGDHISKVDVIKNSYEIMKERFNKDYDMVVDLDITSPLRTLSNLEVLIEKKRMTDADVVFSVTESRRNPYFNMVMKTDEGYKRVIDSDFNTRQEAPKIFDMNASIYAYSPEFLRSAKGIFEGKCEIIEMPDTAVLDIDNENDFKFMEVIAKYLFMNYLEYTVIKENFKNIVL